MRGHLSCFPTILISVVVIIQCLFLPLISPADGQEHESGWTLSQFLYDVTHSDRYLQVLTVCITNSVMIPSIWISYRRKLYPESVCGFMLLISSSCYHIGETLQCKIWGMNYGQWHRLDNVFVIASLQSLFFYMFTATSVTHARLRPNQINITLEDEKFIEQERSTQNLARWISFVFVILCQEKAPWKEIYTFIPIVAVLVYTSVRMFVFTPAHYRPRYNLKMLVLGLSLFLIGVIFFIRGLDDENDYLKINHGLWHSFGGIGFVFLFRGKRESKRLLKQVAQREQYWTEFDKQNLIALSKQSNIPTSSPVAQQSLLNSNFNGASMFRRKDKRTTSNSTSSPLAAADEVV